jgi:pyrroline-5-carboxylate reductase
MRVGIIGNGRIGSALARGLQRHPQCCELAATTRASAGENVALAQRSEVLIVCVKPHEVEAVLRGLAPSLCSDQVVISVAAGIETSSLHEWSQGRARVIRAMPNLPARIGGAMSVLARTELSCESALATAQSLFDLIGRTMVLEERCMDAVTALCGCGPALSFVVAEAMIDAAVALGIGYEHARIVVAQTLLGSAQLMLHEHLHPAALKHEVATPGGRTMRGLVALEDGGLRAALIRALHAAAA